MVYLTRQVRFSAAHRYFLPDLSDEENRRLFGSSAGPSGHGHDYLCEVTVRGQTDPDTGLVVNLTELKRLLQECVVEPLDREYLTAAHPFCRGQVPTGSVHRTRLASPRTSGDSAMSLTPLIHRRPSEVRPPGAVLVRGRARTFEASPANDW